MTKQVTLVPLGGVTDRVTIYECKVERRKSTVEIWLLARRTRKTATGQEWLVIASSFADDHRILYEAEELITKAIEDPKVNIFWMGHHFRETLCTEDPHTSIARLTAQPNPVERD